MYVDWLHYLILDLILLAATSWSSKTGPAFGPAWFSRADPGTDNQDHILRFADSGVSHVIAVDAIVAMNVKGGLGLDAPAGVGPPYFLLLICYMLESTPVSEFTAFWCVE